MMSRRVSPSEQGQLQGANSSLAQRRRADRTRHFHRDLRLT
mgnify:CR=1 FL=1